ncbi:hypothetical protein [Acidihalobacter aeolianus]|uniref:hypothetical protein n=1 Tax=Acidihalobacter aeolianus TaxID=2792603 RepID=UPI0012E9A9C2|nr:hypothetical protein [Acidihalobacter aeolianus]
MTNNKDINNYLRKWTRRGAIFRYAGKHGRLFLPNGRFVCVALSPSDYRALKNLKRDIHTTLKAKTRSKAS